MWDSPSFLVSDAKEMRRLKNRQRGELETALFDVQGLEHVVAVHTYVLARGGSVPNGLGQGAQGAGHAVAHQLDGLSAAGELLDGLFAQTQGADFFHSHHDGGSSFLSNWMK